MNRAIEWFAKNSVAANLMMISIVALGLISVFSIKQEVFPEASLDMISVSVLYRGAAPEEVEGGAPGDGDSSSGGGGCDCGH